MSDVLLDGKVLTREMMVKALVAKHGGKAQTMLVGSTCPEFDEAGELQHGFACRISRWLLERGVDVVLVPKAVPPPVTRFR